MILLMDVGNTNIKIGIAIEDKIVQTWRIATDHTKTADEFGMVIFDLLSTKQYKFGDIKGIIISSVAPSLNYTLEHMCTYYIHIKPIMVNCNINTGLDIQYTIPSELGADRIVNAVAAYCIYGGPCITVDFGSATTFGLISAKGEFLGGAIAPGIKSSTESLVTTAAKLPRIELVKPQSVIGTNTITNMQAGIIFGFTGLVDNIVSAMIKESGFKDVKVIATGGMSQLVTSSESSLITTVDRSLSLKGLRILYNLNK